MLNISDLRVDLRHTPLSLDDARPTFSWKVKSDVAADRQTAYQLVVWHKGEILWDSGKVAGKDTLHIPYAGKALVPHGKYEWQVTVWNTADESAVSEKEYWRTGYMGEAWTARWITPDRTGKTQTSPQLRRFFALKEKPADAVMTVCTTGWHELYVNGIKPDDRKLVSNVAPNNRRIYDTYEVTGLLNAGENAVGLWMGDGYNQEFVRWGWRYDNVKTAIGELRVTYADGTTEVIVTDGNWTTNLDTPLLNNGVYAGEIYDARKEKPWCVPGLADDWTPAVVQDKPAGVLEPTITPPVRVIEEMPIKAWWKSEKGTIIADFGQNIAGWVRLKITAKAGTTVNVHTSEEIDLETREIDDFTNRTAKCTDTYICKGDGLEIHDCLFTYHGFRYIEISGFEGDPTGVFFGAVVHTDMPFTTKLTTDSEEINHLLSNVSWTVRDNAYTYPTDCPMRDERTPCRHDVVNYAEVMNFVWDASSYLKFFNLNHIIKEPRGWEELNAEATWILWRWYGDKRHAEEMYPYLWRLMNCFSELWQDHICHGGGGFGDWCAPKDNADGSYECAFSYAEPNNTCVWHHQLACVADIAEALGHKEDAAWCRGEMEKIAAAFHEKYYDAENGWYDEGEQTVGAEALLFGMVPEDKKDIILQSVVDGIRVRKDNHIDTGIFGTRFLPQMMADHNLLDVVLDAFFNPTYPSFGYEFSKGSTTIWEQWWERGGMTSHNHGMFCGAATALYRQMMGFYDYRDGGEAVTIRPTLTRRVHDLSATVETLRGTYGIAYTRDEKTVSFRLTVPFGCTATVELPDGQRHTAEAGEHEYSFAVDL